MRFNKISFVVILLFLSLSAVAKKVPQTEHLSNNSYIPPTAGAEKSLMTKYDNQGFVKRVYFPTFNSNGLGLQDVVENYLKQNADILGIDPNLIDLELISKKKSLGGNHFRFQQKVNDIPVFASQILVNIRNDGTISSVISDYRHGLAELNSHPSLTSDYAIAAAIGNIGAASFRGDPKSELVYYANENGAWLCWKVLLPALEPLGDWQVFVDAQTGKIMNKRNILCFIDGSGYSFDPNPVVSEQNIALRDSGDQNYAALTAARFDMVLPDLNPPQGGRYYLSGTYVNTQPTSNRANEADPNDFHYNRLDDRFEEVVVYYEINACNAFYRSLGFANIMDFSIGVNVNGTTDDNSWYSPSNHQLTFGSGGVDDGEDGDVVIHEYGHATQHNQVPNWGQVHEGGSMGEGFGDYLTVAFFHPVYNGWDEAQVFDWDANPGDNFWNGRRVDSNKHYPEDMMGEVHADGEIWSRCLWDIQNALEYDTSAQLVLESHFYLTGYANFEDAANAIIQADVNIYNGIHLMDIGQAFVDRGILLEMPIQLDINHQSLGDTEDINGPYEVIAQFDHTNPLDSVQLYYRFDTVSDFIELDMAPTANPDEYSANMPGPGDTSSVYYYIKVIDSNAFTSTLPPDAPNETLVFYAGPDVVFPVIGHEAIGDIPDTYWPPTVSAFVTDNLGVDSVWVEYSISGGAVQTIPLEFIDSTETWENELNGSVIAGDLIEYKIKARDASSNGNTSYLPENGFYAFSILQMSEITYMSELNTPIPDGGGMVSDTISISENLEIYDIDIYVDITHPRIGDLYFEVRNPDNTRIILHNRNGGNNSNIIGWYDDDLQPFDPADMSLYFGSQSQGDWRFFIADLTQGETGTLNTWGIRITGAGEVTSVYESTDLLPTDFYTNPNYPNPFNASTTIEFALPEASEVTIDIYDLLGRKVETLFNTNKPAGVHQVLWNAEKNSTGMYFYRIQAGDNIVTRKMLLLK